MSRHGAWQAGFLALALVLGAGTAWAQRGPGGGGGGRWLAQLKALDLTADQVQKIGQARAEMVSKVAPIRAQLEVKRFELRALWQAKSPSRQAILAKHDEIDALERQVRDAQVGFKLQVLGLLTAPQRAQLQKSLDELPPPGWGRGRGKGFGRGAGPGWAAPPEE